MDDYYTGDAADEGTKSKAAKTALLPRSMLGECKPGDTISLRVERVIDDEVEVAKVDGEKKEDPTMPKSAMMEAEDEMDQFGMTG